MPLLDTSPRNYQLQNPARYILAYYVKSIYLGVQKHCPQIGPFAYPPMYIVRHKYIIFASILVDMFPSKTASIPHGYAVVLVSKTTVSTWLVHGNWSTATALVIT